MRLFILGATGGTGRELVAQALARGHTVTAFVRSPDKLPAAAELTVVAGDPRDLEQLAHALIGKSGHDAVLSALGATSRGPTTLLGDTASSTIEAMQRAGVRRLMVVSSALLFPNMGVPGKIFGYLFRHALRDSLVMEERVANSGLDWNIVRPPRLTNGKARGKYRVDERRPPAGSITRADLAASLLDELEQRAYLKKVVGVSK